MRPQSCKSKGRRFQQRVARDVLAAFPHLAPDDVVSTSMGAPGEDVRLSPRARTVLPLSLECKCVEKLNVWSCLEQAAGNTPAGATPCLVFTRNRAPAYAVVPWDALLALYAARDAAALPARLVDLLRQLAAFAPVEAPPAPSMAAEGEPESSDAGDDD